MILCVCVCVGCLGEKKRYTRQTHGVETDRVIPGLNRITKERQMFECRGLKKPNIINLIDAQLPVTISKRPRIVFNKLEISNYAYEDDAYNGCRSN